MSTELHFTSIRGDHEPQRLGVEVSLPRMPFTSRSYGTNIPLPHSDSWRVQLATYWASTAEGGGTALTCISLYQMVQPPSSLSLVL